MQEIRQESSQAAFSIVRSRSLKWGIDPAHVLQNDYHIHVPAGSVPKDGPSAGITMATAMLSAFTNREVRSSVAMTGEITLRGIVLPVGGIKEKVLAARRSGIRTLILPEANEKNLVEVPKAMRRDLEFVFVKQVRQVFEAALLPARPVDSPLPTADLPIPDREPVLTP